MRRGPPLSLRRPAARPARAPHGRARRAWCLALALGVGLPSPAWAGRPLATEDPGTLDPGVVEVELAADYVRDGRVRVFLLPNGPALNVGLAPRLEGTLATQLVVLDPGRGPTRAGPGDSLVRLKGRVRDESPRAPALMGAVSARLPTGDAERGLGERGVDVQLLAVASKAAAPLALHANAGYTLVTRDRGQDTVLLAAAAEVALPGPWSAVGEVVGELATRGRGRDRLVLRAGLTRALGGGVRADGAIAVGTTPASPDLLLTVGLTVELGGRATGR